MDAPWCARDAGAASVPGHPGDPAGGGVRPGAGALANGGRPGARAAPVCRPHGGAGGVHRRQANGQVHRQADGQDSRQRGVGACRGRGSGHAGRPGFRGGRRVRRGWGGAQLGHRRAQLRDARTGGVLHGPVQRHVTGGLHPAAVAGHALRADDPRQAARGRDARGPHVPGAHRERLRPARLLARGGGGDVAVHEQHRARRGAAGGLVDGRAARPGARHRCGDHLPGVPHPRVRVAVPGGGGVQRRPGARLARTHPLCQPDGGDRGGRPLLCAGGTGLPAQRNQGLCPQADRGGAAGQDPRPVRLCGGVPAAVRL